MKIIRFFFLTVFVLFCGCCRYSKPQDLSLSTEIRPAAVPLVTVDPYFSVWSFCDSLNDSLTVHWTGRENPLVCYARVDGVTYCVLGQEDPIYSTVVSNSKEQGWTARYIIDKQPGGNWMNEDFDDSLWPEGEGAFGSGLSSSTRTEWQGTGSNIWIRRKFNMEQLPEDPQSFRLYLAHDDACEVYINGTMVVSTGDKCDKGRYFKLGAEHSSLIRKGENTIAIHCFNKRKGCEVDCGIALELKPDHSPLVAEQKSLSVLPTRTVGTFACGPVEMDLIFTAPLLMDDLELVSRPVNYVTFQARSADNAQHEVQVFFEASPKLAVDSSSQPVATESGKQGGVKYARAGTIEQNILGKSGDNVKIDWGYVYVASTCKASSVKVSDGDALPVLSYSRDFGRVGKKVKSDFLLLAYDDLYSVQFMGDSLRPYWNRSGERTIFDEIRDAAGQYERLMERCAAFDRELMDEAFACGGKEYAELCALAYRQAVSAHKLVESPRAGLLFLSKENFSNGSIGTVDITYPSAPLFLYYNPELAKALMNHIFYYCEDESWDKPFAAHDVGTYPLANGQTYGGDMPVEENGNMLILSAAIAKVEGDAGYALRHWDILTTWADYLVEYGFDPENQLCTDDFAGHFAHNTNLSIKAIMGIESYSILASMSGKNDVSARYHQIAVDMAARWKEKAVDTDHYKLTFDKDGTWSQKYNLVWDVLLGTEIFDPSIRETEIEYYKGKQNRYGLPLDNRKTYTKTDWIIWTATMADSAEDFESFIHPVYRYQNETTDRVPMSDWVYTDTDRHAGFQARSVVGGYYIKMLHNKWKRD